jgi:branched-chain amino acid transport system permease protein
MSPRRSLLVAGGLLAVYAVLPLVLAGDDYTLNLLVTAMIFGALAISWDLLLGYAGVWTFGQIGFFVCGAYASGMLSFHAGWSPWLGLVAGAAVGALASLLIGLPSLRLRGVYVALVTLAFFMVLGPLLSVGRDLGTGGSNGLLGLPPYSLAGYEFGNDSALPWYALALALFALCLGVTYATINSRLGSAFIALRDSEALARSLGVDRYRASLMVMAISGALAGLMGAFYAHFAGIVSPRLLGLDLFLLMWVMMMVGGVGRFPGAAIGALVVTFLNDNLRQFETARTLVLGALVVVLVMLMPRGIMGALEDVPRWIRGRRRR